MLCWKNSANSRRRGSVPVYLSVYDLTTANGYAYWFGLGVHHSGVQVHGVEFAFGAHEYPTAGIFEGEPKKCEGYRFRRSVLVGWSDMSVGEVRAVMESLAQKYRGNAYNLITKNCNHFCNDACIRLTGNGIPSWVNRLARIGSMCRCLVPMRLNTTKVRHHRIEDRPSSQAATGGAGGGNGGGGGGGGRGEVEICKNPSKCNTLTDSDSSVTQPKTPNSSRSPTPASA
ncbi:unnamed protein product [Cuscuta campestris]|uniref:PPPDE domain-containing protein n=1 Tax=Cuscuta campestris TaxID=132261 RepID=A0A484MEX9_9ASTE|nr:unnamed protein product [Cuscuta campestris]